jgi:Protein of unknown function (DUF2934)
MATATPLPSKIPAECRPLLQDEIEVPLRRRIIRVESMGGKRSAKKDGPMSNTSRDEWISKRAYAIWEAEGRPHGRDADHWLQAMTERERLERTRASTDGNEVLVKFPKKPKPRPAAASLHRQNLSRAS